MQKWFDKLVKRRMRNSVSPTDSTLPVDRLAKTIAKDMNTMAEEHKRDDNKKEDRHNSMLVNPTMRAVQILVFDEGDYSMEKALGTLEVAKDLIKREFSQWHAKRAGSSLLIPKNGNGGLPRG